MAVVEYAEPQPHWLKLTAAVFFVFWQAHQHRDPFKRSLSAFSVRPEINAEKQLLCFEIENGLFTNVRPWLLDAHDPRDFAWSVDDQRHETPSSTKYDKLSPELVMTARWAWRQMRSFFNSTVTNGSVQLFGRVGALSSPFTTVPVDLWPHIDVVEWVSGKITLVDGTTIWTLHAAVGSHSTPKTRGPPPKYDRFMINKHVERLVVERGLPKRGGEKGWRTRADLESEIASFCEELYRSVPAKSTLQSLAAAALKHCERTIGR